jgi:hypothetical protein
MLLVCAAGGLACGQLGGVLVAALVGFAVGSLVCALAGFDICFSLVAVLVVSVARVFWRCTHGLARGLLRGFAGGKFQPASPPSMPMSKLTSASTKSFGHAGETCI